MSAAPAGPPPAAELVCGDPVDPLDMQFGVIAPKSVPDDLRDMVFGPVAGEDCATYAILNGAKIDALPQRLAMSGLEHACLFQGEAFEEMGEVAPWVVRVEDGNRLVQQMFTAADSPLFLWAREAFVVLRSPAPLSALVRHLRKYTRIRDEAGAWFYQCFWEPATLGAWTDGRHTPFLGAEEAVIRRVIGISDSRPLVIDLPERAWERAPGPPLLTAEDRVRFDAVVRDAYARKLAGDLVAVTPGQCAALGLSGPGPLAESIVWLSGQLAHVGFTRRSDIGRVAVCALYLGTYFLNDPRLQALVAGTLLVPGPAPALRALRLEQALKQVPLFQVAIAGRALSAVIADLGVLETTGALPAASWRAAGLEPAETRDRFVAECGAQADLAGLSPDRPVRLAHLRLAMTWGPWVLSDPLHRPLLAALHQPDPVAALRVSLGGRAAA